MDIFLLLLSPFFVLAILAIPDYIIKILKIQNTKLANKIIALIMGLILIPSIVYITLYSMHYEQAAYNRGYAEGKTRVAYNFNDNKQIKV